MDDKKKKNKYNGKNENNRRDFLKNSLALGIGTFAGTGLLSSCSKDETETGEKVKMLTTDGKLVEVSSSQLKYVSPAESREGIPGKKFVMVIDLARCRNARKCVSACQHMHYLPPTEEWIKVFLMKDSEEASPYWFPKTCFHCDNPPCVKVCPVGATFKRTDGLVLVDTDRCIGCKFCITACPYSARVFHWEEPKQKLDVEGKKYSPETSVPSRTGTVGKCDFCPDMARMGKVPDCVSACPNGTLFYGDANEDMVTNGSETFQLSKLIEDRAGYQYMADLGTSPNVYYLPPVDRAFNYEEGFKNLTEDQKEFYLKSIVKKH